MPASNMPASPKRGARRRGKPFDALPRNACLARSTVPAWCDLDRAGRQLRHLLIARHTRGAVSLRLAGRDGARRLRRAPRSTPTWCGTAICPTCAPGSCTAIAFTARTIRARGTGSIPTRSCSIRTRSRSAGRSGGTTPSSATRSAIADADLSFDTRDNAAFAPLAAVIDPAFTWGDDRPPRTPWHKTVIYEMHVKGFTKLHPRRARTPARHLRGADDRAGARASAAARRHRRRADAGASPRVRPASGRARAGELLGLQHAVVLRARHPLFLLGPARRIGARVQADGQGAAQRRPRSHPRRRLQPHRRGQPPRPDAVAARHRQRHLLPARCPTTSATTWTSPAAATR